MQKVALVLLVLLAVLFAVGVAVGAGRGGPAGKPRWATTVQDWFVRERPLLARELRGPCVNDGAISWVMGTPCTVQIARRKGVHIRHLKLKLVDGAKVQVQLAPKSDDMRPMSLGLRSEVRKPPTLPILEDGATITLLCVLGNPITRMCVVSVL
jgi:hypothetical protein